ncbi:MAG: DNA methyltransferase, partial [Deltaproteobacteria bacterium]|nr:DNA methyltransferase [Deltaproteobacteria bacterium]
DIRQGVAIALFVKKQGKKGCKVYHSERWGLRDKKYEWLQKNNIKKTKWKSLSPKSETYFFIPRDERLLKAYERFPKITEIFPVNSVGIVTSRDNFVIDSDKDVLKRRIKIFCDEKMPDDLVRQTFSLKDKPNWKLKNSRENIRKDEKREDSITKILYRPFDIRWVCYHDAVIERSRKEVMRHMLQENLGLITVRQVAEGTFNHALIAESIVESRITLSNKGIGFLFPLYLYPKKDNPQKRSSGSTLMLFEPPAEYSSKTPNLSPDIVKHLRKSFEKTLTPEDIFYYVYATLYSTTYRIKYAEFLKSDFPRVPFTKKPELFSNMATYGKRLAQLHLLQSSELNPPIAKFRGKGEGIVEKLRYDKNESLVCFNQSQYFEGISTEVWDYQIGGYQVCHKWLKDRKGRTLSTDDIKQYCRIVTAIQKTIEIQKEIDDIYPQVEIDIIKYH